MLFVEDFCYRDRRKATAEAGLTPVLSDLVMGDKGCVGRGDWEQYHEQQR